MEEKDNRIDPDFETIIKECIEQLRIKFPNYGNTWLESDTVYYKQRLKNEIGEYIASMTIESEKRKLINIINIAAMAWQTAKVNKPIKYVSTKCPNCVEPLSVHVVLRNQFVCST